MSGPFSSRITDSSSSAVSNSSTKQENHPVESGDSFLELIVSNSTDYRAGDASGAVLKGILSPLDRLARERVFDSIVRKTLENPEHPYYSLVSPDTRKEMIQKITALLNSSHYLNPVKRQA